MAKNKQISQKKELNLDDEISLDGLCLKCEIDFGFSNGHIRTFKPDDRARFMMNRLQKQEKKKK